MRIDAHQHFWRYQRKDYGWIDEGMSVLRRDFLPEDLRPELAAAGIDGCVAVQARQCLVETEWLLALAAKHDFIRGVVGWVPLSSRDVGAELERFAADRKFVGVRHVVQDEPDPEFLLRPEFNAGIELLRPLSLTYDILIFERHLPQAIRFVDRHPDQVFVVDHFAKPRIAEGSYSEWADQLKALAKRPNVYLKLSGLVTEADHARWTEAELGRYFELALAAFGPGRLMFGSDWPVCLLACNYARWHALVATWIARLTPDEQARIWGGTAAAAYRL